MSKWQKLLAKIISGKSDNNIDFNDLINLLVRHGFRHRQEGSHNIFTRSDVVERINIQSDGSKAKRYQVRQIRNILIKYNLEFEDDHE